MLDSQLDVLRALMYFLLKLLQLGKPRFTIHFLFHLRYIALQSTNDRTRCPRYFGQFFRANHQQSHDGNDQQL